MKENPAALQYSGTTSSFYQVKKTITLLQTIVLHSEVAGASVWKYNQQPAVQTHQAAGYLMRWIFDK